MPFGGRSKQLWNAQERCRKSFISYEHNALNDAYTFCISNLFFSFLEENSNTITMDVDASLSLPSLVEMHASAFDLRCKCFSTTEHPKNMKATEVWTTDISQLSLSVDQCSNEQFDGIHMYTRRALRVLCQINQATSNQPSQKRTEIEPLLPLFSKKITNQAREDLVPRGGLGKPKITALLIFAWSM